jgi:hypothetical protein
MQTLRNRSVMLEYDETRKEISGKDLLDTNNEPCFYTKTKRNISSAWKHIYSAWGPDVVMHDIIAVLTQLGIKTHYWCAVD